MREPTSPQDQQQDRKPGRSFDDPSKPLGEGIIQRSAQSGTIPEDLKPREVQAATAHNGVAERAKAVSVLRKLEELIADNNPSANDEPQLQCALDLACGRVGLTRPEYNALVQGDAELVQLEEKVLDAARAKFVPAPTHVSNR